MNSKETFRFANPATYAFGEFRLEAENLLLFKDSAVVPLAPKASEVLLTLIKANGKLLTKQEILDAVWPDAFVEEANLTHHISALRKALGEDKNGRKFIETIPRRGYRFVAAVSSLADAPTTEIIISERTLTRVVEEIEGIDDFGVPSPSVKDGGPVPLLNGIRRQAGAKFFVLMLASLLIIGVAAAVYYFWFHRTSTVESVAVLPFKSMTGEPVDPYLQLGLADALITKLSSVKKVAFRPTSSILKFTDSSASPVQVGRELGVDAILEGLIQRQNDRLKVSVQLVKTSDGAVLWAESFDEKLIDIQRLQDSISEKITSALALELTGEERKSIYKNYTSNAEAYQLYLQGRFQWFKFTPDGWQKAVGYYQQAVDKDPNFALAYSGLGFAYSTMGFTAPSKETHLKSKAASLKALELDNTLAETHALVGLNKFLYERDPQGARESLLHALHLSPNSAVTRQMYAIFLVFTGEGDEAVGEALKAVELDPLSAYMHGSVGAGYYFARQPEKAIEAFNKSLELDPNYVYALHYLTRIYERKGQFAEAENYRERDLIAAGERESADELRMIFAAQGYRATLEKRIEQLKKKSERGYVSPMEFASVYVSLADKIRAMESLEKAYEEESFSLMLLNFEPHWDGLRADADFQNLLRRINQNPAK